MILQQPLGANIARNRFSLMVLIDYILSKKILNPLLSNFTITKRLFRRKQPYINYL